MNYEPKFVKESIGRIISIQDNIIIAHGLSNTFLGEVVKFKTPGSEIIGQVLNLEKNLIRIVIIKGSQREIKSGDSIHRTFKDARTKVGFGILGKLISPLGDIINEEDYEMIDIVYSELTSMEYAAVEKNAPGIIERESVKIPFLTGINAVDCFIPIGCGQRELIIGDHSTGKTSFAITSIINQKKVNNFLNASWRIAENNMTINGEEQIFHGYSLSYKHSSFIPCIHVGIGQKRSEIARLKKLLENTKAIDYTTLVFTSSDEPASIQFIAPYAGCTIGEWYRDNGYKAVAIYDDLSQHAVAYRQMSLLLRRPPGREAYPGDVFYVHSRLLERAAQMHRNLGGGALTALPIIETRGGDISAYIPTNVISITDGQVFLSTELANKGFRPAINIGLSVSRVGSAAQTLLMRELSRKLKGNYSFYNTFRGVDKLGGDLDPIIWGHIKRGLRIDEFFKQGLYEPASYIKQVLGVFCLINGLVDTVDTKYVDVFFHFLFSNEFSEKYIKPEQFHFALEPNEFESWFFSNLMEHSDRLGDNIHSWCKSTTKYFGNEIQPRLARDKSNMLINSFKNWSNERTI
jgi:proton translocating ATP synthase F1 alpha subunit